MIFEGHENWPTSHLMSQSISSSPRLQSGWPSQYQFFGMHRWSLQPYSSSEHSRFMIPTSLQSFSSSPESQSCSWSHLHLRGMHRPSSHLNSLDVQLMDFLGQFSSSDQSPQSLSPSHRNLCKMQRPPGPPMPPNIPLHLYSPSGQFGIGKSQFISSLLSSQSGSPSHLNAREMHASSKHWNSSFVQLSGKILWARWLRKWKNSGKCEWKMRGERICSHFPLPSMIFIHYFLHEFRWDSGEKMETKSKNCSEWKKKKSNNNRK